MRVTERMMAGNLQGSLAALKSRMARMTDQISSGNRIRQPSDDPGAAGQAMRLQSKLSVMEQWETNLNDTRLWLGASEAALDRMTAILSRAREIAVAGANGATGEATRTALAPEIRQLTDELLEVLNAQQLGSALFAGTQTALSPFSLDPVTGLVTYAGNAGEMRREIGPGITVTANLTGTQLGDWADPENMLTALWQLAQDLENQDHLAASASIGRIDGALEQVIAARALVGGRDRRLDQAEDQMRGAFVRISDALEQARGVDMAKAILELSVAETAYRAALQTGARSIPPTLADFLR